MRLAIESSLDLTFLSTVQQSDPQFPFLDIAEKRKETNEKERRLTDLHHLFSFLLSSQERGKKKLSQETEGDRRGPLRKRDKEEQCGKKRSNFPSPAWQTIFPVSTCCQSTLPLFPTHNLLLLYLSLSAIWCRFPSDTEEKGSMVREI